MPLRFSYFNQDRLHGSPMEALQEVFAGCVSIASDVLEDRKKHRALRRGEVKVTCTRKLSPSTAGVLTTTLTFDRDLALISPHDIGILSRPEISLVYRAVVIKTTNPDYNVHRLGVRLCQAFGWKIVDWNDIDE
jgi:hypothetical protein